MTSALRGSVVAANDHCWRCDKPREKSPSHRVGCPYWIPSLELYELARLLEAYDYRLVQAGDDHLTAEKQLDEGALQVIVFHRLDGTQRRASAWHGAFFIHGITDIKMIAGIPVPNRVRAAARESKRLLTLGAAQDWMATLP